MLTTKFIKICIKRTDYSCSQCVKKQSYNVEIIFRITVNYIFLLQIKILGVISLILCNNSKLTVYIEEMIENREAIIIMKSV